MNAPERSTAEMEDRLAEEAIIQHIAPGKPIPNAALQKASGLDADKYLAARNRLRDRGAIYIGRGRGGVIHRLPEEACSQPSGSEQPVAGMRTAEARVREARLYERLESVLSTRWVKDESFTSFLFENTSAGGRRPDGKWTRPDITCVALSVYKYLPEKYFDVITFEVKPTDQIDVTAVYEALAHRRAATRSYVLLHVPDDQREAKNDQIDEVSEEASKHGIGVIVVADPANYDTREITVEPSRGTPDPYRLNLFLQCQLAECSRDQILGWVR